MKANSSKTNSPVKSSSNSPKKKGKSRISVSDSGTDDNDSDIKNIESVTTLKFHEESSNTLENVSNSKSIFTAEDIASDDEVFTFQCPETFKKQELCNKYLDFTNFTKLITKSDTFDTKLLSSEKKYITLAVPKNGVEGTLFKLPLKGHVVLHKNVDNTSSEAVDEDDNCTNTVLFPSDLKVRHPLLGIDWKAHIQQADGIINQNSCVKKKNKKIKTEKIGYTDAVERKTLKREHSPAEILSPKQKRKKI